MHDMSKLLLPWRIESNGQHTRRRVYNNLVCNAVILPYQKESGYSVKFSWEFGWTEWKYCQSLTEAKEQADAELVTAGYVLIKEELSCMI